MKANRKESKAIKKAIANWQQSKLLDEGLAAALDRDIEVANFDWGRLAKYCFWISIICIVIAVAAVLADQYLRELLRRIFEASYSVKCLALTGLSCAIFGLGVRFRRRHPDRIFSNEAVFFFGVLTTAGAVYQFGQVIHAVNQHYSLLILLSCVIYGVLGLGLRSTLIWLFALVSLGSWLGAETGYESGWGAYFLGMNYPVRFAVLGAFLTAAGLAIEGVVRFERFYRTTLVMGLLYLFVSLWLMSIFGNYGDMDSWHQAKHVELFQWSVLFAAAACAAIYHGLRYDNAITKGFGLTFLFINLYTRYFEYFWDMTHKAIFFAILGVSFWILGRKAEAIWNLGREAEAPA
jgi:hypothetical protein